MVFSSFVFLCLFLPAVFLLHTVIPDIRARNLLLIVASLLFYAYGEPVYVLLLLFSAGLNWLLGLRIGKTKTPWVLALAIAADIGILVVFKYAGFLVGILNFLLPADLQFPVPAIRLPIGISFYSFQALSYVIDVYRGEGKAQDKFLNLLLYLSFFPQLIAGPIIKYHDVEVQIRQRSIAAEEIKNGIYRFSIGLGKKMLIANTMAYVADGVFVIPDPEVGLAAAWIGALSYLMQIYFDFSGYSDMAIGLGQMFGFHFRENFNYPYISTSIREFWRRWHISLSAWFKEYLYIPLGGNRKGKLCTVRNKLIVFLATGLWHGANGTFLLWGIYHGLLLMGEEYGVIPVKKCRWRIFPFLYTFFAVTLGFVVFRAENLGQALVFLKALFGFGAGDSRSLSIAVQMLSPQHIVVFLLALIGSTPLPKRVLDRGKNVLYMLVSLLLLLLSLMALASDSYNPFIYFRF